jgi:hypothetical protein
MAGQITWIDALLTPKIHLMLDGHLGQAGCGAKGIPAHSSTMAVH